MLFLAPKCQGYSINQKTMTLGTKNFPPKKIWMLTAVKQYVDPQLWGDQHKYCYSHKSVTAI